MGILNYFKDLIGLVYPELCVACGDHLTKQETVICLKCLHELPETKFHLMKNNPVEEVFWGRVNVKAATALCYFVKNGRLQELLHALKYHQRKDVGEFLGKMLGESLLNSPRFREVNCVAPIPLHPKKERLRGYNQSDSIGIGISTAMGIELGKPIKRVVYNPTQTRKARYERWENVSGIFEPVGEPVWHNKHFLLVDDVMTTGSTLEAAAVAIQKIPGAEVSIAVIGLA